MTKQQRYSLKHKEQGLCLDCPRKVAIGSVRCEKHKKNCNNNNQKNKKKRIEEGRCRSCGSPKMEGIDDNHISCINCRQHLYTQKYKEHNATSN